jgi:hypothetical protein
MKNPITLRKIKIKTSELQGTALNWAVETIECEGAMYSGRSPRDFSGNWALGGPIIEREELSSLKCYGKDDWECNNGDIFCEGPTPLIAAMRCFVASRLGDEIEIPEELK